MSLPHENEPLHAWMARVSDEDRNRKLGTSWRSRVLRYRKLADLMAEAPPRRNAMFSLPVAELSVLAHHVIKSGMTRGRFLRMAVGYYLVNVCGEDPKRIPSLSRDL